MVPGFTDLAEIVSRIEPTSSRYVHQDQQVADERDHVMSYAGTRAHIGDHV